jgi:nitroimidazol reductase NimA-like FMN-containing flavoprotein (pyridoxamine 5'-phosphate oxidase superfamily)
MEIAKPTELAQLSRSDCLRLLGKARLGRVGVSVDALPAIFPVFITVVDDVVVFRTVPGTKLTAASDGAIVALEVDAFDESAGEGWSVLVRGVARELADGRRAEAARLDLDASWMHGASEHLVEVSTDLVTGRRLS